ncbi:HSCARG dehydrogenase [Aspergillus affinis]|uniref:HSCARG dehydrogenase n=1 Tax=Aspergillus affinis TaxID=1070780 RepID=UPI0022FF274B|nr:HSCARG dehydrogenase [Aspergillus affinis]KAI9036755.1 HSCARG dehydrogenase [Aspergillus affinis]
MSNRPKIVIFGATGQQGRSIVNALHTHPLVSQQYFLRAITRNTNSPSALSIASQGIETVSADMNDPSTLPAALENAHTVILITLTVYTPDLKALEYKQTKDVADAAVAAGAKHIIYSAAVDSLNIWTANARAGMKPRPVDAFDSKAEAEDYLRTLPIKSTYFAPGGFMQNFVTFFAPRKQDDGSYMIANVMDKDAKIPLIDIDGDSGTYVSKLLVDGSAGETLYAAGGLYSFEEIVGIISRVSGKNVKYVQVPEDVFAGFMQPEQGMRTVNMMKFVEEVGYFGPRTEALVEEGQKRVDGKVTRFEEFAEKYLVDI